MPAYPNCFLLSNYILNSSFRPGPRSPFITAKEEVGDPGILCFTNYFDTSDFEG